MKLKTYLKKLISVADVETSIFKGYEELTHEQQQELATAVAGIQNSLGCELEDVLAKFDLKWDS